MLVGYMRVSSDSDRQSTDLQRDALVSAGVDARHLFTDHASGAKDDRPGLTKALDFVQAGDVLPGAGTAVGRRALRHDYAALTPLIWEHVNPYGRFELDMSTRLALP